MAKKPYYSYPKSQAQTAVMAHPLAKDLGWVKAGRITPLGRKVAERARKEASVGFK
jgi:hypothetical protein